MAKGINKFLLISVGGLIMLMVFGMIIAAVLRVSPEEVRSVNLIEDWMYYRISFYVAVVLGWTPMCHWITRPRNITADSTEEEQREIHRKGQEDMASFKALWWKIAAIFVFFEIVVIQQFGL